jgi:hypothetical protein
VVAMCSNHVEVAVFGMDFFGDDDEGGDDLSQTIEERRNKYRWEISQQILKFILSHRDHHIQSEILIISDDPSPCEQVCFLVSFTSYVSRWRI